MEDIRSTGSFSTAIFESLQNKIDEDSSVRDEIKNIIQDLERQGRLTQAILSRAHSTAASKLTPILDEAERSIAQQRESVGRLSTLASQHPFYKFNQMWSKELQNLTFAVIFNAWLGGFKELPKSSEFMTIEEVGAYLNIPVNVKDRDVFHLTIEEYLLALTMLVDELARLAVNSVTLGDYQRPLQISKFIKELHAGFSLLNLKNDILRRKSDGIKYAVKKVEDVVYDLSLRNLIPKDGEQVC